MHRIVSKLIIKDWTHIILTRQEDHQDVYDKDHVMVRKLQPKSQSEQSTDSALIS